MEAMARIAALVPPPHSPLLRYHGVLAAGSPLRARIVPVRDKPRATACPVVLEPKPDAGATHAKPEKPTKPKPPAAAAAAVVHPLLAVAPNAPSTPFGPQPGERRARSWRPSTSYIPWAELMRRTLDTDPADCPACFGRLQPIALITP